MRVEMFAIRQQSTGHYLPAPQGRQGRGGSHMEPAKFPQLKLVGKGTRYNLIPRIWATRSAAQIALTHWLRGKVNCYRSEYWDEDIELIPQGHRNKEDMEIVSVFVELP